MIANDNLIPTGPFDVRFHAYNRWCAITINGQPVGYMSHYTKEGTSLHLKHDAPAWLREVRARGPFVNHEACQQAIKDAAPRL